MVKKKSKESKSKSKGKGKGKGYTQVAVPRAALHPRQVELYQVATSVPLWMKDLIEERKAQTGRSASYIVREALAQYFNV